jgi:hypothetical protein
MKEEYLNYSELGFEKFSTTITIILNVYRVSEIYFHFKYSTTRITG